MRKALILLVLIILVIFAYSLKGNIFLIGGDLIFPLSPKNNFNKSIFSWSEYNSGSNLFGYTFLFWNSFFYLLSLLNIPVYISQKIFLILLFFAGFFFTYLSFLELFKKTKWEDKTTAFLAAVFFTFSPAFFLTTAGYMPMYGFPICFFFLLKFLNTKKKLYVIPFAFFLNLCYFTDFPQPKMLVVFSISLFFLIVIYKLIRQISFKKLVLLLLFVLLSTVFVNAVTLFPFFEKMFGKSGIYNYLSREVIVYSGDADWGSASLLYIPRFFNSNLINDSSRVGQFLKNPIFIVWTFLLWTIVIIGCLKAKEGVEKKIFYLLLLAVVFFIFLAKGSNIPFGFIYKFLLFHFPPFKIFRTAATVILGALVFYSFLLAFSFKKLFNSEQKLIVLIIIINIYIFKPILLGHKFDNWIKEIIFQKGMIIPKEYFQMGQTLDGIKEDVKIGVSPQDNGYVYKDWGYNGQSPIIWLSKSPIIRGNTPEIPEINDRYSQKACLFTSWRNIGYFLFEKDEVSQKTKELYFKGEDLIDNRYFRLKKVNNDCLLPHFFTSKSFNYYDGEISSLSDLYDLPDFSKESSFYIPVKIDKPVAKLTKLDKEELYKNEQVLKAADQVYLQVNPYKLDIGFKNRQYERFDLNQREERWVYFPFIRSRPDSLMYYLAVVREKLSESRVSEPRMLFDKKIEFANKRIGEINKWGSKNDWWPKTLRRYEEKIEEAIKATDDLNNKKEGLQILIGTINSHKAIIEKLLEKESWSNEKKALWSDVFKRIIKKCVENYQVSEVFKLDYKINIPVEKNYQLFVKNDLPLDQADNIKISLNSSDLLVNFEKNELKELMLKEIAKKDFKTGTYDFKIEVDSPNLLEINDFMNFESKSWVERGEGTITFNESETKKYAFPKTFSSLVQELKEWQAGHNYLLKIKYKTTDKSTLGVIIDEKKYIHDSKTEDWKIEDKVLLKELVGDGEEMILALKADDNSLGAKLYLYGSDGPVIIDNIELKSLIIPQIFLRSIKNNPSAYQNTQPQITFQKINPTKYRLKVKEAKSPYLLVFSESFDFGWKIYESSKDLSEQPVLKSYSGAKVQEIEKTNRFFYKDIFEWLGKKYLPEERHLRVNAFANQWLIQPEDVSDKSEYNLVIEYLPQRLIYLGGLVSIFSTMILLYLGFKVKTKNRG